MYFINTHSCLKFDHFKEEKNLNDQIGSQTTLLFKDDIITFHDLVNPTWKQIISQPTVVRMS